MLQPLVLILLSYLLKTDMTAGRYFGFTVPFACLLIAEVWAGFTLANRFWEPVVLGVVIICSAAEGVHLVSLMNAQKATFAESTGPQLVITKDSQAAGPGVPATILHDIPAHDDFVVLPDNGDHWQGLSPPYPGTVRSFTADSWMSRRATSKP